MSCQQKAPQRCLVRLHLVLRILDLGLIGRASCLTYYYVLLVLEDEYYQLLGDYKHHFDKSNYALVWLARANATRSFKLSVPKSCRLPKSTAGQNGYSIIFRKLHLQLRSADTKSGHWHYWYFDPKAVDFKALQRALQRRWKESPFYAEHGVCTMHITGSFGCGSDPDA